MKQRVSIVKGPNSVTGFLAVVKFEHKEPSFEWLAYDPIENERTATPIYLTNYYALP